jgi:nitroimidazol reductase NimA-like FMN-containing flavoprotein (pyridoxamine 5'-phosphate oxidase superfamily)
MGSEDPREGLAQMEAILRMEKWGCLGLSMDGRPYVVPVNYAYVDGDILFHCALEGQKLDYIRANPNVCFTVARQTGQVRDHAGGNPCHLDSDSVICYGTAHIVEDPEERAKVLNAFNHAFVPDARDISTEGVLGCGAVRITIDRMTGRRERERGRSLWRFP